MLHRTGPVWKIAHGLVELSLDLEGCSEVGEAVEQDEAVLCSYELPSALPTDQVGFSAQRHSVAARTIVTAARGGQLRCLALNEDVEAPFAVRALLPHWVDITFDFFGRGIGCHPYPDFMGPWLMAAQQLRPLLSHASRWLDPESNHLLSPQDMQALRPHFQKEGLPEMLGDFIEDAEPVERYLLWLQDDAELATQASAAWSASVERGDAVAVRCRCELCSPRKSSSVESLWSRDDEEEEEGNEEHADETDAVEDVVH